MYHNERAHSGIRSKVILGFTVTLLAVMTAGFITYDSTNKLINSLTTLSKPDNELRKTSDILALLGEAESNIRIFSLTRDYYYFEAYSENIKTITLNLAGLKTALANSESASVRIDSISKMLNDRYKATSLYIDYLDSTQGNQIANRVLRNLIADRKDSLEAKVLSGGNSITSLDSLAAISPTISKDRGTTSFFSRLTNLLRKKQNRKRPLTEPSSLPANTKKTANTNIFFKPDTSFYTDISRLLSVMNTQETEQQMMTGKEIELLRSNAIIIEEMMNVVKQIETQQMAQREQKMREAHYIANKSVQVIFIVICLSLVVIIFIVIMIFRSVARSNSFRNQLIESKIKAEKLAKVKEDFLANMSHEIRTPLNAILGFSEQLAKSELGLSQKKYLDVVRKSSEHLLLIVNDILDYSRLGAGKLSFEIIPFLEQEVISEVFETLSGSATEKKLTIEVITAENSGNPILGDPFRLKQVLLNLVGNAIKFTVKGSIRIESKRQLLPDDRLIMQISVSDTGIGIAEDKLSMIFNDFTQADTSSTREYGGSGLGLAICKRLVEMQDGTISVESTPGTGSKFTVSLPCTFVLSANAVGQADQTSVDISSLHGKRILLVDDDAINILLSRIILENQGMIVEVAMNGREGIEKAAQDDFDLVLTDMHMPEIGGMELTRLIRSLPDKLRANIPIIAITANIIKEDLERYLLEGIDGIILKPFKEDEVYAKICEVLALAFVPSFVEIRSDSSGQKNLKPLYDLTRVRQFAGNKTGILTGIIQSFILQSREDMAKLEILAQKRDWIAASEVAHKMLTSFGYFGVNVALENLLMLDKQRTGDIDQDASDQAVKQLRSIVNELTPLLEKETGE